MRKSPPDSQLAETSINEQRDRMHQSPNEDGSAATSGRSTGRGDRRTVRLVCLVLAAITLAVFGRTTRFEFVNYDDGPFVYNVPAVTNGLTIDGVARAFTLAASRTGIH